MDYKDSIMKILNLVHSERILKRIYNFVYHIYIRNDSH